MKKDDKANNLQEFALKPLVFGQNPGKVPLKSFSKKPDFTR